MIYLANTFFEYEAENQKIRSLEEMFKRHPLFRQLQYLPLIFLSSKDTLLVSDFPRDEYLEGLHRLGLKDLPRIELMQGFKGEKRVLKSWASSHLIERWANENDLSYEMPAFEIAAEVNSKLFSYAISPKLPYSRLLFSEADLLLDHSISQWVIKTVQGFSGLGNFIFETHDKELALKFCEKEWQKGNALILEPWVERVLDFSSQWEIHEQPSLIGITKCINHPNGGYRGTDVGENRLLFNECLPYVEEQVQFCKKLLEVCIEKGYFGYLGVDAMIYKDANGGLKLHPVVEINARMTMSLACLLSSLKYYSDRKICHWKLERNKAVGFLPENFKHQLTLSFSS